MKVPYCCTASQALYENYYTNQQRGKGDFPVYVGRTSQRGHGLGNILGSLFRSILPGLKAITPHVLETGVNVVNDVSRGKNWRDALIDQVPRAINKFAFGNLTQSGRGIRRKRVQKKQSSKRIKRDIFS